MQSFFIKLILTFVYILLISSLFELYYCSFFYLNNKTIKSIFYIFPQLNSFYTFFKNINLGILKPLFLIYLENIFVVYYIFLTFFIKKSFFNIPKILKYNILLSLTIILIHYLIFIYWNLLLTQHSHNKLLLNYSSLFLPKNSLEIYSGLFILFSFFIIILKYYVIAMQNKFPTFFPILTNSIAFWTKINLTKIKK